MKVLWYLISIFVIIFFTVILFNFYGNAVTQPIRYNHNLHLEEAEMDCIDCHQYYESNESAGLPSTEDCSVCHSELLGDIPEEKKLFELIENEVELNWKRIFQMPKHVFFSHRRHIILAQLECDDCHGNMKELTSPPQKRNNKINMEFCMDCHETQNVSNDCISCHR